MKMTNDHKVSSPHLQLPLKFGKTDPGDLNDADLIARVKPVYERIRDEKLTLLQHDTLFQINRMIEMISGLLENVHVRDEVRNMALVELQKIKKAIEAEKPGSLISFSPLQK